MKGPRWGIPFRGGAKPKSRLGQPPVEMRANASLAMLTPTRNAAYLGSVLSAPLLRGVAAPSSEWQLSRSQRLSEKQFARVLLPTSSPIPANPPCILRLDANRHGCVQSNLEAQCKRLGQHASNTMEHLRRHTFTRLRGVPTSGCLRCVGFCHNLRAGRVARPG